MIFYAMQDRLGANSSLLVPGLSIRIPVSAATPAAATATLEATTEGESPATAGGHRLTHPRIEF
ncbi:MAG: hypothetical protein R3D33_00485 [Hyphomicrobiaceae bacterium]